MTDDRMIKNNSKQNIDNHNRQNEEPNESYNVTNALRCDVWLDGCILDRIHLSIQSSVPL